MSDLEDSDFFFNLWTPPEKRKRKKRSKKDKKGLKHKNEPKEGNVRKKKSSKFKETMKVKKEKKKKKTSKASEANDDPDQPISGSTGKTKRKKKVEFDLSSSSGWVNRPKYASSSPTLSEAVADVERCSQAAGHDNDSQCDDINSQDLFITQKAFRVSPSQPSSGETSDKPTTAATPTVEETRGFQRPPQPRQKYRKPNEHKGETKSGGKAGEDGKRPELKRKKVSQSQTGLKENHPKERRVSCPARATPHVGNLYLNEPIVVDSSPDAVKRNSSTSSQRSSSSVPHIEALSRTSRSTQTENFFTAELSSYIDFCRRAEESLCSEELKPLDLSLPRKARKDLWSVKTSALEVEDGQKAASLPVALKDGQKKKLNSGRVEKTPSPQSESEAKSGDTTASSEDSESHSRLVKLDLNQVRAVQTRLNESFFFKTKGEAQSPRPESPLMKLAQGREVKISKRH